MLARISHNARTYNRWGGDDLYRGSSLLTTLHNRVYPRFDLTLLPGKRAQAQSGVLPADEVGTHSVLVARHPRGE